jgi:serine/threonine-protein kinase
MSTPHPHSPASGSPLSEQPTLPPPQRDAMPALESAAPAAAAVQTIAGYVIEGELGRGGMGVVYKARQKGLNRTVALKMILHADCAGTEERRRFEREAQALAGLRHENIVQVYEVGEHDGKPFFSLEYVDGGSLDERLRDGSVSAGSAPAAASAWPPCRPASALSPS